MLFHQLTIYVTLGIIIYETNMGVVVLCLANRKCVYDTIRNILDSGQRNSINFRSFSISVCYGYKFDFGAGFRSLHFLFT